MVAVRKGLRGVGNGELLLNGYRASVLQDEKPLGTGCKTIWIDLVQCEYTELFTKQ